ATRFFELGCTGRPEMSSFQALSAGNTCMAARILSASGVLNITGSLIGGSAGSGRPLECLAPSCGAETEARVRNSNNDKATARRFMAHCPQRSCDQVETTAPGLSGMGWRLSKRKKVSILCPVPYACGGETRISPVRHERRTGPVIAALAEVT